MKAIDIIWDIEEDDDVDLPNEIEIPDGMYDLDEIDDYISNETGFCHMGFTLSDD